MIKISNLRLEPLAGEAEIKAAAAKKLGIPAGAVERFGIARMSIDARRGRRTSLVCSVVLSCADEEAVLRRCGGGDVAPFTEKAYVRPPVRRQSGMRPVVVGMGPAGLFAALYLAEAGFPCVVLERGGDIDSRAGAVECHWRTGVPDARSNVQFGEGGAGAFSDGKLTTGTHDIRTRSVLQTLCRFGAPEDILWSNRPHVGTDILRDVVKNIRRELVRLGCDVRFNTAMTGLRLESGRLAAVETESGAIETDSAVLAIGHSARDSFFMLEKLGLELVPKPFSVGVRIEHRQADIGYAQYGELYTRLPPADYRLAEHLENGRSAYSFCVCPGGVVVASSSEPDGIVTNGMSYRARDGVNINGALLVSVTPEDFGGPGPLAGVGFQREIERAAFVLGGSDGRAPAQTVGGFMARRASEHGGSITPSYRPGVRWTALDGALPDFVCESLRLALPRFGRKVRGFDSPDAVLTGVETRSSSPVRIVRGDGLCATRAEGVYPCGEGAGYAGGIVSAAVDGIRAAEAIFTRE